MQKELTNAGPLLNERGELCEAGYARRLIKAYDRRAIKAAAHRIKEWDYYLIMNGRWGVALTIDDNSYMGLLGFSLLDFSRPWEHTPAISSILSLAERPVSLPAAPREMWR